VSGQVRTPGEYVIRTSGMTVRQALALAGGVTERGSSRRVQIIRVVNGKEVATGVSPADGCASRRHNRRAGTIFLMADLAPSECVTSLSAPLLVASVSVATRPDAASG
jgi:protein involved in polysaccharide export with SLBB domain